MGESFGGGFVKATLTTQLRFRRDTSDNFRNPDNPDKEIILAEGEPAFVTDMHKFVVGDGIHSVADLPFAFSVIPVDVTYSTTLSEVCAIVSNGGYAQCFLDALGPFTYKGYINVHWRGGHYYHISLIDFESLKALIGVDYYESDKVTFKSVVDSMSALVFSSDLEGYVTLDTEQEISGKKSFVRSILRSSTNPEEGGYVDVGSSAKPFDRMFATYSHIPWSQTNFAPASNNTYSLGSNENGTKERYWKNLYLHENIISKYDPDDPASYFTLPVREIVDFHSEQTLTGIKIFEAPILIGQNQIFMDNSNRINLCYNDQARVKIGNAETLFVTHVSPDSADKYNLGRSGLFWKDLYLSDNLITKNKTIAVDDIPTMQDLVRVYDLRSVTNEE